MTLKDEEEVLYFDLDHLHIVENIDPAPEKEENKGDGASANPPAAKGDSLDVTEIVIHQPAGGWMSWRRDGLSLVVSPRHAKGQAVTAAADVSVIVVDPELPGEVGRLGSWDFKSAELATGFAGRQPAGLQLAVPMARCAPARNDLHLFVRYTTGDGAQAGRGPADQASTWPPGPQPRTRSVRRVRSHAERGNERTAN